MVPPDAGSAGDRARKVRVMIVVWALWSLLVWPISFLLMFLVAFSSLLVVPFVPFRRFTKIWPEPIMGLIPRLTFSRFRFHYHPGFDRNRVTVYIGNHTSMLDAHVAIMTIPQVFCGIMNAAHLWVPAYGWIMKMASAIPVERGKENQAARLAELMKERASRNISVLVFPEAHRTLDGKIRPFKRGAFFMARDAGLPIVPIAFRGLYQMLPKGTWILRPAQVDVLVGPRVETTGMTDAQVYELMDRVRRYIVTYVEEGKDPPDSMLDVGPAATGGESPASPVAESEPAPAGEPAPSGGGTA